jgi:hypothetical protein
MRVVFLLSTTVGCIGALSDRTCQLFILHDPARPRAHRPGFAMSTLGAFFPDTLLVQRFY